jgi:hypothetical protein
LEKITFIKLVEITYTWTTYTSTYQIPYFR